MMEMLMTGNIVGTDHYDKHQNIDNDNDDGDSGGHLRYAVDEVTNEDVKRYLHKAKESFKVESLK